MLPRPDYAFAIPSLHDGISLDGRLYFPRLAVDINASAAKGIAIIAHPYAPLGGCMDDPVVQLVSSRLLKLGFIVNIFNFRGAHGSTGNTSWTGNPELADYVSFVVHMLHFINAPGIADCIESKVLVLGGYSYGSMIASCLPDLVSLQRYISLRQTEPCIRDIILRAVELSQVFLEFLSLRRQRNRPDLHVEDLPSLHRGVLMGGNVSQPASGRLSRESLRQSFEAGTIRGSMDRVKHRLSTSTGTKQHEQQSTTEDEISLSVLPKAAFLLISPILPPIATLITLFSRPSFDLGSHDHQTGRQQQINLSQSPSLACFGSKDMFTSARKLKRWAQDIYSLPQSKFTYKEIPDAGHFWREPGVEELLQKEILSWAAMLFEE